MKRSICLMSMIAVAVCLLTACGEKSSVNSEAASQHSESYEAALAEWFNAAYSSNGGKIFYSYMYPDAAVDNMISSGIYDELIEKYNYGQQSWADTTGNNYSYGSITDAHEINETQEAAVKEYFISLCSSYLPDLSADQLDVKEGYEVAFKYLNNGEEAGTENVLVISLNDEGWKIITG